MAKRFVDRLRSELELLYRSGDVFRLALLSSPNQAGYQFTVSLQNNLIAPGHNFVDGVRVQVFNSGGALPDYLEPNKTYFVKNVAGDEFNLTESRIGNPIIIEGGSGTHTIIEQLPDSTDSLLTLARLEVDYYGATARPVYAPDPAVIDYESLKAYLPSQTMIFEPVTASIVWRYSLLIRNGTDTRFDTTGEADNIHDYGFDRTIVAGSQGEGINIVITRQDL